MAASGLHTTAREIQTCTFERPGTSNTTKILREDPQREKKITNFAAGDGKRKREILGPPPFGAPKGVCSSLLFFVHLVVSFFFF